MLDEQTNTIASSDDAREVVVTVTTIRYTRDGEMDSVREAVTRGTFDEAMSRALTERLFPWALDQVLGKILARRPALGQSIEYEGWFEDLRQFLVSVCPANQPGSLPVGKPRQIKGLFIPRRDRERGCIEAAST
jgi:hypothetical protein